MSVPEYVGVLDTLLNHRHNWSDIRHSINIDDSPLWKLPLGIVISIFEIYDNENVSSLAMSCKLSYALVEYSRIKNKVSFYLILDMIKKNRSIHIINLLLSQICTLEPTKTIRMLDTAITSGYNQLVRETIEKYKFNPKAEFIISRVRMALTHKHYHTIKLLLTIPAFEPSANKEDIWLSGRLSNEHREHVIKVKNLRTAIENEHNLEKAFSQWRGSLITAKWTDEYQARVKKINYERVQRFLEETLRIIKEGLEHQKEIDAIELERKQMIADYLNDKREYIPIPDDELDYYDDSHLENDDISNSDPSDYSDLE